LENPVTEKPNPEDRIAYGVKDAAALIGVSPPSIYEEIKEGRLPSLVFAGRRLILREDLIARMQQARDDGHVPARKVPEGAKRSRPSGEASRGND
jgi:excisionase family DNA binding protein